MNASRVMTVQLRLGFFTKCTNRVFVDPDPDVTFTVVAQTCEFCHGRKTGGWYLLSEPNTYDHELEGWNIVPANKLMCATKQTDGVHMDFQV